MELVDCRIVAEGLRFPEGPIALDDGTVLVNEIRGGCLTRVLPDGRTEVVAETGGGPNGSAFGPDGLVYVCNNGGLDGKGGPARIERVDLRTGKVERLFERIDGRSLRAPNDLVFDATGGFWFTEHGWAHGDVVAFGSVSYVPAGGGEPEVVVGSVEGANGVGLAPDGSWVAWAETRNRRVIRRPLLGPGKVAPTNGYDPTTVVMGAEVDPDVVVAGMPSGLCYLDSMAVDSAGHMAVGALIDSGIAEVALDGTTTLWRLPAACADRLPTNLCFAGADLRTAWITLSDTGRLATCTWHRPGLQLANPAPWTGRSTA